MTVTFGHGKLWSFIKREECLDWFSDIRIFLFLELVNYGTRVFAIALKRDHPWIHF
jgi:hypothetical protein